jgi:hypothetical protein
MAICAVAGVVWAIGAGGQPGREAARAVHGTVVDSNPLATRLAGTWTGTRHDSGSKAPQAFTMTWKMVSHREGDSLWGTFEMRPTAYKGRTEEGRFSATKRS